MRAVGATCKRRRACSTAQQGRRSSVVRTMASLRGTRTATRCRWTAVRPSSRRRRRRRRRVPSLATRGLSERVAPELNVKVDALATAMGSQQRNFRRVSCHRLAAILWFVMSKYFFCIYRMTEYFTHIRILMIIFSAPSSSVSRNDARCAATHRARARPPDADESWRECRGDRA